MSRETSSSEGSINGRRTISSNVKSASLRFAATRSRSDRSEGFLIECVQNEPGDIVLRRVNQWSTDNFLQRQVCKFAFCRNSFSFRSCGDASQLVARLFLVSLGKKFAEIGKIESLDHGVAPVRRHHVTEKVMSNGPQFVGKFGRTV